jgi:hypothetical protein
MGSNRFCAVFVKKFKTFDIMVKSKKKATSVLRIAQNEHSTIKKVSLALKLLFIVQFSQGCY